MFIDCINCTMPCYRGISYVRMSVCHKGAEAAIRLVLFGMCVLMTYPTLHYKEIRLVIPSKINLFRLESCSKLSRLSRFHHGMQGRRQVKICAVDRHGEREPITGVWRRCDPPPVPRDLYLQEWPLAKVGWTCPPRGDAPDGMSIVDGATKAVGVISYWLLLVEQSWQYLLLSTLNLNVHLCVQHDALEVVRHACPSATADACCCWSFVLISASCYHLSC